MKKCLEKKIVLTLFFIAANCIVQGQDMRSEVSYRNSIIDSSIEHFFYDFRKYTTKGLFDRKTYFDLSTFPTFTSINDSIFNIYKTDFQWVYSIKQIVRENKDNKSLPTFIFSWDVDEKGRLKILYKLYYVSYDIEEDMVVYAYSDAFIYYYKYNNDLNKWEYIGSDFVGI